MAVALEALVIDCYLGGLEQKIGGETAGAAAGGDSVGRKTGKGRRMMGGDVVSFVTSTAKHPTPTHL